MAVGKNKKLGKKRKGGARKAADPFTKKEWYKVLAPQPFQIREICHTVVTKTQGTRLSRDGLLGRVFEANLGDLKPSGEDDAFRKFQFKVEEVQGAQLLTSFYGMDLTAEKIRSLVKKWSTLIEAFVDVRTADGYGLRLFCIGFTKAQHGKKAHAQTGQVRVIRKKMVDIMTREVSTSELSEVVNKLQNETIGKEIEKAGSAIYPLQNVMIRKVKLLKAPKLDLAKLIESHGGAEGIAKTAVVTDSTGIVRA